MMQLETRYFPIAELRLDSGDEPMLRGHAAVFNRDSVDMGFIERVAPGAFSRSLKESDIIHAFWSHNPAIPLGSTRGGKLALSEDETGLAFELSAKRLTDAQRDAVLDGDMHMSFGFRTRKDKWEQRDGKHYRTLLDVDLFEISLVAMPAYPDTSVALRSLDEWRASNEVESPTDIEPAPDISVLRAKIRLATAL